MIVIDSDDDDDDDDDNVNMRICVQSICLYSMLYHFHHIIYNIFDHIFLISTHIVVATALNARSEGICWGPSKSSKRLSMPSTTGFQAFR